MDPPQDTAELLSQHGGTSGKTYLRMGKMLHDSEEKMWEKQPGEHQGKERKRKRKRRRMWMCFKCWSRDSPEAWGGPHVKVSLSWAMSFLILFYPPVLLRRSSEWASRWVGAWLLTKANPPQFFMFVFWHIDIKKEYLPSLFFLFCFYTLLLSFNSYRHILVFPFMLFTFIFKSWSFKLNSKLYIHTNPYSDLFIYNKCKLETF